MCSCNRERRKDGGGESEKEKGREKDGSGKKNNEYQKRLLLYIYFFIPGPTDSMPSNSTKMDNGIHLGESDLDLYITQLLITFTN